MPNKNYCGNTFGVNEKITYITPDLVHNVHDVTECFISRIFFIVCHRLLQTIK